MPTAQAPRCPRGFTLVEVLVATGLAAVLLSSVSLNVGVVTERSQRDHQYGLGARQPHRWVLDYAHRYPADAIAQTEGLAAADHPLSGSDDAPERLIEVRRETLDDGGVSIELLRLDAWSAAAPNERASLWIPAP